MKKSFIILFLFFCFLFPQTALAQQGSDLKCIVYVTGIGCPHCGTVDNVIFKGFLTDNPDIVLIDYEVFENDINKPALSDMNDLYRIGNSVPLMIFDSNTYRVGDLTILQNLEETISKASSNCPLADGEVDLNGLNFDSLSYAPMIWRDNRVFFALDKNGNNDLLMEALLTDDLAVFLENHAFEPTVPSAIPHSGGNIAFNNAVKFEGWVVQWNDKVENEFFPETVINTEEMDEDLQFEEYGQNELTGRLLNADSASGVDKDADGDAAAETAANEIEIIEVEQAIKNDLQQKEGIGASTDSENDANNLTKEQMVWIFILTGASAVLITALILMIKLRKPKNEKDSL